MTDLNYLKLAAEARRETDTEREVRAKDAYDIVVWIHRLEDRETYLEERLAEVERILADLAPAPEEAKGFGNR